MSPTETVSRIAHSVVDNLKSTPVVLALILLNLLFMGAIYFAVQSVRKHQHDQIVLLLDRCVPRAN